jgi:hypothetical protein
VPLFWSLIQSAHSRPLCGSRGWRPFADWSMYLRRDR